MNITKIISVSPVNPAHGRHEVLAHTNEGFDIAFTISPDALGALTGYFDSFPLSEKSFQNFLDMQTKAQAKILKKKGS